MTTATDGNSPIELTKEKERANEKIVAFDMHCHILPKSWGKLSDKYGEGEDRFIHLEHNKEDPQWAKMMRDDGKFFRDVWHNCWDSEVRMKQYDSYDVQVQVLSTVPVMWSMWAKPENTADLHRYLNDNMARTIDENPKRYAGLGAVPLNSPSLAIKELHRLHDDLGMQGVMIGSHIGDKSLDDGDFFEFFKVCEQLDMAIFVHPWDMPFINDAYWAGWLCGMPAETSKAICDMIFGGVFERLPKLKVCFAHGGGSFPATCGRVQQGFMSRPDLCAVKNPHPPRDYVGKFWLDSLVHDEDMLKLIVDRWGSKKVCLGSDFPFPLGEFDDNTLTSLSETPYDYLKSEYPGSLVRRTFADNPNIITDVLQNSALDFLGLERERFLDDGDI